MIQDLIKKYTQLDGISGNEGLIKKEIKVLFNNIIKDNKNCKLYEDNLGSIGLYINNGAPKTLAFMAHQDEVGLMVKKIDEDGIVKVINVGGLTVQSLVSQRVKFKSNNGKEYIGIILAPSPHVKQKESQEIGDLKISFGFKDEKEATEIGLELGSYLYFVGGFEKLENNNFVSKAFDNRVGVAVIDYLAQNYFSKSAEYNLFLGASVQEELGVRGISPLLNTFQFPIDEMYMIDVSPVDNMEDYALGDGPLIRRTEPGVVYSIELNNKLNRLAGDDLKVQNYFAVGGTDARAAQITKEGYQTTAICIPALNLHTNSTIINMDDINNLLVLIERIIQNAD